VGEGNGRAAPIPFPHLKKMMWVSIRALRSKARNLSDNAKFIQLLIIPDTHFEFFRIVMKKSAKMFLKHRGLGDD
jgi:hypothetical protein